MRQFSFVADVLKQSPLMEGLTDEQVRALLKESLPPARFARGEVIFSAGAYRPALAFILSGTALVYKRGCDERRLLMSRLSPGSLFGMATLFGGEQAFPTEIVAETQCDVLFVGREKLEAAFDEMPRLSRNYIALLSERIRFLNQRLKALSGDDISLRLLHALEGLKQQQGSETNLQLPFSLSQLAEYLGVGRASLYRALTALTREGIVTRSGKTITVHLQKSQGLIKSVEGE